MNESLSKVGIELLGQLKISYFFQALCKLSDALRLIREQQRQVLKVLLDGLYDPNSPLSNLLGVRTEVVGEIIWQKMLDVRNWRMFPLQ